MARRSFKKDKGIKALHEGKRISSEGNTYYEYRKNRSDKDRRKKFENGGGVGKKIELEIINVDKFDKFYDEVGYTKKELSLPYDKDGKVFTSTNDKSIAETLKDSGMVKYSNGGGVGNSFGEIYNRVVQYIIDKEDMSREDAVELVDSKETWLRDMIEFHEEYDTETLAEGITSDMGEMKRGGIFGFGTSRSKSALAKDRKYFNKNEKHEVQYAKTFKRRKKTYDKYEKGGGVDEEFDIDEKVIVNGKEGNIVSMLGKETKDPNELDWYEIKFNDGSSDHYPVTEIKKYSNGGGVGDFENEPLYLVKYITTDGNVHEHTLASYGEGSKDDILETLNKYTLNGKNVSVLKLMSIKRMDNVMNGIYANGGGVGCGCTMRKPLPKLEYKYGGELTDENMVRENLINGEIHSDILSEIIGRKPNYPNEIVGAIVLTKCFLRPYYRIS